MKKKQKIQRLEILMLDQDKRIKRLERQVGIINGIVAPAEPKKVTPIKRNRDIPGIEIEQAFAEPQPGEYHDIPEIREQDGLEIKETFVDEIDMTTTPWATASSEQILGDVARHVDEIKAKSAEPRPSKHPCRHNPQYMHLYPCTCVAAPLKIETGSGITAVREPIDTIDRTHFEVEK